MDKTTMTSQEDYCSDCMRIACKKCDWVASEKDLLKIQREELTACPQCGWQPK